MKSILTKLTPEEIEEKIDQFETLEEALHWLRIQEQGLEGAGGVSIYENQGATVYAVYMAHQAHLAGLRVYSNLHLKFPHSYFRSFPPVNLTRALVLLDHAELFIDSRMTASRESRLWTYTFAQARRRDLTIYLTVPNANYLDRRALIQANARILCVPLPGSPTYRARLWNVPSGTHYMLPDVDGNQVLKLYDPKEIVRPPAPKKRRK